MRLDILPESWLERLGLSLGMVPAPIVHTMVSILMSRVVMTAVRSGVFEALKDGPLNPSAVSSSLGTDESSTTKLLSALEGLGYLNRTADSYSLSEVARRWLTSESPVDLSDAVLHRYLDADLMDGVDEFVRTGTPVRFHQTMTADQQQLYVTGQRAQARLLIPEIVRKLPLDPGMSDFLDLGGSHGLVADAVCRQSERLRAVVMDLPESIRHVDRTGLSPRVSFEPIDILRDDLPHDAFDLVFLGNVAHHFRNDENRLVFGKIASALRPGGFCAVADFVIDRSRPADQIPALLDFYFALTSGGGTWSFEHFSEWMQNSGLYKPKIRKLRAAPGMALITARKP